jgi:hypothetical protein
MTHALTDADLDALRMEGDPEAGALIDLLYGQLSGRGRPDETLRLALGALERNGDPLPEGAPEALRRFCEAQARIGTAATGWDEARLHRGARFFAEYGLQIPMVLHMLSLPLSYAAWRGARVLCGVSRKMVEDTDRRITATAQMVLDVMAEDGLAAEGRGRVTVLKVRLWHEILRRQVLRAGPWDAAAGSPPLGVPINQEDLLGTLMCFSVKVVDGLKRLGATFRPKEAEDYYYRWKAIGVLMGIRPEALPANLAAARALCRKVQQRHYAPSEDGRVLTAALIRMMQDVVPGPVDDPLVPALMRHMLAGEDLDVADMLGIPAVGGLYGEAAEALMGSLRRIYEEVDGGVVDQTPQLKGMICRFARTFLHSMLSFHRGPERLRFTLPPSLAAKWKINDEALQELEKARAA